MIAEIHVTLKPTLLDAQGKTVQRALQQLGHRGVRNVRIGKHIQIEMEEGLSNAHFEEHIETMCRQLLANPVIEDYSITIGGETVVARTRDNVERGGAQRESGANIATSDTVPSPRPMRSNAAAAPSAQPARLDAPRLSAPQPVAATVPLPSAPAENIAPPSMLSPDAPGATPLPRESFPEVSVPDTPVGENPESDARAAVEARPTQAATPPATASTREGDPFAVSYENYRAMSAGERLELQGRALQTHGAWIRGEMENRRAQWILCAGQNQVESGESFDTYPDETRLAALGQSSDLAPFVFTRPPV